jgi:acyl-CoA hydrolase
MHKSKADSLTVMTELVLPNDVNILGNLLGGRLLHWIDIAGAMAATRHCETLVATVMLNPVEFKRPIKLGGIVILTSYVVWTGSTSVEVAVEVHAEDPLTRTRVDVNKVYVTFVALDGEGRKQRAVPFVPLTDEEKREHEAVAARKAVKPLPPPA